MTTTTTTNATMTTAADIEYRMQWCGRTTIPAGTPVRPADNLPGEGRYWVEDWDGMTEADQSWARNYGFLVESDEVTTAAPAADAAPSTLTIGRTTYTVDSFGPSSVPGTAGTGYITGPRGGVQNVIVFDNGCVRLVQYSRGAMPRGHRDLWGDEADAIRAALMPTENDESTADAESVSVADLVEEYRAALQTSQNESDFGQSHGGKFAEDFTAKKGRRYWKIVRSARHGSSRSVHSFVDATTGQVLKAEGWSKPARGARFDLTDPASRERCMDAARRSGGMSSFLYR